MIFLSACSTRSTVVGSQLGGLAQAPRSDGSCDPGLVACRGLCQPSCGSTDAGALSASPADGGPPPASDSGSAAASDSGPPPAADASVGLDGGATDTGLLCSLEPRDGGYPANTPPPRCGDLSECDCLTEWQPYCRPDYCSDCAGGRTFAGCAAFGDPITGCPPCPTADAGVATATHSACHGHGQADCPTDGTCNFERCPNWGRGESRQWVYCGDPSDFLDCSRYYSYTPITPPCPDSGFAVYTATGAFHGCERGPAQCYPAVYFSTGPGPNDFGSSLRGPLPDCVWPYVPAWDDMGFFPIGCVLAEQCPTPTICGSSLPYLEIWHPTMFPVFDKHCDSVADCAVGLHALWSAPATDPNGCSYGYDAVGINVSQLSSFQAAETTCRAQVSFRSACTGVTDLAADDLTVLRTHAEITATSTVIQLQCLQHTCKTTLQ
jgi:hypothetical protein